MKIIFYATMAAFGLLVAALLELRAGHLFHLFPQHTSSAQLVVSPTSGFRQGRLTPDGSMDIEWKSARLCGLALCWDVNLVQETQSAVTGRARLAPFTMAASLDWNEGTVRLSQDFSPVGQTTGIVRVEPGRLDANLWEQKLQSLDLEGRITEARLDTARLGEGPFSLRMTQSGGLEGRASLAGGATPVAAEFNASLDEGTGRLQVTFDELDAFQSQTAAKLRRILTFHQGQYALSARIDLGTRNGAN